MKGKRVAITLAAIGAVVALVAMLPLPHYVVCTLEVRPRDAAAVYVDVPGRIEEVRVKPGQRVEKDQMLARLDNIDRRLQLIELVSQRDEYRAQHDSLREMKVKITNTGHEVGELEETLVKLDAQVKEREQQLERLNLTAPVAGVVLAPTSRQGKTEPGRLPSWSGLPTDPRNLGATLDEQQLFCLIGDPLRLEAVLIVDQGEVDFVHTKQPVRIKLESHPGVTFHSQVTDIGGIDVKETSAALSVQAGGDLETKTDQATGTQRPISTSYQAKVPLEDLREPIPLGTRGQAKIFVGWQPLGARIWRTVSRTFHFSM